MELNLFSQIAISLLLGLLIGLQRQRTEATIGGIRTFPLIAAFGTICGWLAGDHGGWIVAAGLLALAALLVVGNVMQSRAGNNDAGQTTEVAALLLYGIGAFLVIGEPAVAVALGGVVAAIGGRRLLGLIAPAFVAVLVAGACILRWWPAGPSSWGQS